jgi:uncharacterized protein (TIGR03435 family)
MPNFARVLKGNMAHFSRSRFFRAAGMLAAASLASPHQTFAQPSAAPVIQAQDVPEWQKKAGGRMSFEVASIKRDTGNFRSPNFPFDPGDAYAETGGRLSADFSLMTYITFAYKLSPTQEQRQAMIAHLPKWIAEDRFNIQAKAVEGNPTKDQMRLMMQALLADRFKLAVHFETQEGPALALVLVKPGKLGPKLRPHSEGPSCDAPPPPGVFPPKCHLMAMQVDQTATIGSSRDTTIVLIAGVLPAWGQLARPVVDRTGLSGSFDFTLEWSETAPPTPGEPAPDTQGTSFQSALREQLGLKLEATKAPLRILVIDRVERPSEN